MYIELHILQNFAPSNLNRSDTGSPKDCEFGGVRRGRISSQCFKRAMRDEFKRQTLFQNGAADNLAVRTKRLVGEVAERLVTMDADKTRDIEQARRVVETAAGGVGLKMKDSEKTQYLLFLGRNEIDRIARLCHEHYAALLTASGSTPAEAVGDPDAAPKKKASSKDAKRAARDLAPKEVSDGLKRVLDGGKAADLALFGRMLADLPDRNIDAASQVAHAISTNKINVEFDFYTAVDDLRPQDTEGADMLGTVEFNSACFYRYLNMDASQLRRNLQGDDAEPTREVIELGDQTIAAFIRAAIAAVPTGKQNSTAAQQRPSFVLAIARDSGLCSLANAFVKPVAPDAKNDLVTKSVLALATHYGDLARVYGEAEVIDKCFFALGTNDLPTLEGARVGGVQELVERMRAAARKRSDSSANGNDDPSQGA